MANPHTYTHKRLLRANPILTNFAALFNRATTCSIEFPVEVARQTPWKTLATFVRGLESTRPMRRKRCKNDVRMFAGDLCRRAIPVLAASCHECSECGG